MKTNATTPDLTDAAFEELAAAQGVDLTQELTTGFAARLIRRKAKQIVGKAYLTPSDRPEVEHILTMRLLERLSKFDPEKAHWNAFVTVVIEKHVATVLAMPMSTFCCKFSFACTTVVTLFLFDAVSSLQS